MGHLGERSKHIGNTQLVKHGVLNEESDYRIHVSFSVGKAYFFPTSGAADAVRMELGREFKASQHGTDIITGMGRKVDWHEIEGCREVVIPQRVLDHVKLKKTDSTTRKGRVAVNVARWLLTHGCIPIPAQSTEITDEQIQVKGKDLIVTSEFSIEVKCDWWGGVYGLALQTHECNPFGLH